MDKRQEEFLAKLRETFRAEAAEHLDAMAAGLVAIEGGPAGEAAGHIESVFREAHSLKGAARAVSLAEAESLCQALESVFASMKRGELAASTELLDGVHAAHGVLLELCATPSAAPTPEAKARHRGALAALETARRPRGEPTSYAVEAPPAPTPVATSPAEVALPSPVAIPTSPAAPAVAPARTGSEPTDTVRVSTLKLGAILLRAEELLGAKIAVGLHTAELRDIWVDLGAHNRKRATIRTHGTGRRNSAEAEADLRAADALHAKSLESALGSLLRSLQEDSRALASSVDTLLDDTRQVLMHPCSHVAAGLPKIFRDLTRAQGKEGDLVVCGTDLEVDRRVLDALKDPLIHLLRNAVDHAIERPEVRRERGKPPRATVTIAFMQVPGRKVEITVEDDGGGIDLAGVSRAAAKLTGRAGQPSPGSTETADVAMVFESGLSTSPIITDLSGRGLGLAIVREKVEQLGGTVSVATTTPAGTTFRLVVPLTIATFRGVLVAVCGQRFIVPAANVVRAIRVAPQDIRSVENRQTVVVEGRAVSLARLRDVLGLPGRDRSDGARFRPAVVVRAANREVALLVDEVLGEQEAHVKSLGAHLTNVRNVSAASVAANGAVIPILDAADLVESAILSAGTAPTPVAAEPGPTARPRILVVDDSITARTLVKNILETAGFDVSTAVDGLDALTTLRSGAFELVVSDVDMPRMNGFELTGKIRADPRLASLPVILVTALAAQSDREYGIEVGANAYVVKSSFDQDNLLALVRRFV